MKGLSKIGAAAHAPFMAAAAPQLFGMESWQELVNPRDLGKLFDATDYAAWRSFRASEDSRYMALTMPRFLGRQIYGAKTEPVEEFDFEEEVGGAHDKHLWLNAAYAMGVRITDAFKSYGWCTRIRGVESGGTVEDLPTATFPTDDGGVDMKCPTEIAISDRREAELSGAGLMALIHRKNTDQATFIGAQTVHKPKAYVNKDATANANCPRACRTFSRAAVLRTISNAWCATGSAERARSVSSNEIFRTGSCNMSTALLRCRARRSRPSFRSRMRRSRSCPIPKTPAITRASSCSCLTTSWKA